MKITEKIKKFFNPPIQRPEDLFEIILTEEKIICKRDDGIIEKVTWNELEKVEIQTNDLGPFVEDVFWVLHGRERGCVIPQSANGTDKILDKLQSLPSFNNELFMEAMSCTENKEFIIWEREQGTSSN